jgi:hypothetical protein
MYSKLLVPIGVEGFPKLYHRPSIEIIQHQEATGTSIKPNTDTDSEWIFQIGWIGSKNGDDTKTLSFSDEWIRVWVQIVQKLLSLQ